MTPRELFTDFIQLTGYKNIDRVSSHLTDISLASGLLARKYEGSITVIGLTNGTRVQIPQSMVNVFIKFCEKYADSILAINKIKKGDNVSKFIILMVKLVVYLENQNPGIDNVLGDICELGSKDFREWCMSDFGLDIRPISFNSLENNMYL